MATAPANIDPRALTTGFEDKSKGFAAKAEMLRKLPATEDNAEQAHTWDTPAKNFLATAEAKRVELKAPMLEAIRRHDQFWADIMAPAKAVRAQYTRLSGEWERIRRRQIEEQKRLDEQRQLEEQKRQQKAEAEHLLAIAAETNDPAALEAAIEAESAPLAPVVSSVDTNAGKVVGSSVTLKKTGLITDARIFFMENPWSVVADLIELKPTIEDGPVLRITQSSLDDKLNRGIELKGVMVYEKAITRNLSR